MTPPVEPSAEALVRVATVAVRRLAAIRDVQADPQSVALVQL